MINKNDINKVEDSLDVPPISKDWFTKEWRLNKNNDSYRFKVRSIEYADHRRNDKNYRRGTNRL